MSATIPSQLDLRGQIARIDLMREEARKFSAEQTKLAREARRFYRERWAVYAAAIGGLVGGTAGVVSLFKVAGR